MPSSTSEINPHLPPSTSSDGYVKFDARGMRSKPIDILGRKNIQTIAMLMIKRV
jgi:hypothetical protein